MIEFEFPDYTKYHFINHNNVWWVCSFQGETEHRYPYDKAKFCERDYRDASPNHTVYWDWLKISRNERKGMRAAYIRTNTPLSFQDYRDMKIDFPPCTEVCSDPFYYDNIKLGNCTAAAPPQQYCTDVDCMGCDYPQLKQGNNPMRIETTNATAYVTAPKSDDAISREYLINRLEKLDYYNETKSYELRKLFKLDAPRQPESAKQLIEMITKKQYKLDEKRLARLDEYVSDAIENGDDDADINSWSNGPFDGIIFTGFPKPDRKGYDAAMDEYVKAKTATKDIIMVSSPADGLKALQALIDWTPETKTVH